MARSSSTVSWTAARTRRCMPAALCALAFVAGLVTCGEKLAAACVIYISCLLPAAACVLAVTECDTPRQSGLPARHGVGMRASSPAWRHCDCEAAEQMESETASTAGVRRKKRWASVRAVPCCMTMQEERASSRSGSSRRWLASDMRTGALRHALSLDLSLARSLPPSPFSRCVTGMHRWIGELGKRHRAGGCIQCTGAAERV
jgi:hypothetical protein